MGGKPRITARTATAVVGFAVILPLVTCGGGTHTIVPEYDPAPTIATISPASGPTGGGTAVTLTGTGFLAGATIVFGSAAATAVTVVSPTQITATTPAGSAGAVNVVVTNPNGLSGTLTSGFTFQTPNSGSNLVCIPSGTLPDGNPLVPYHATLTCSAGTPPYTWSLLSGTLPSGLTFNPNTGLISGTPSGATEASFTAEVTDSSTPTPQTAQIHATLNIITPGASDPELPQVFMDTTFPNTSGYISKTVCASECNYTGLQAALNNIHTDRGDRNGEMILLASGTTFTGNYTLPAYSMAAGKWVIVRTNTADSNLPGQGVRITPTYSSILAKVFSGNSTAVFQTANNANHYWLMGVEMGVSASITLNYGIFGVGNGDISTATLPQHIVLDRCYVHGNATGNIRRGLAANGANIAVINSDFENFHDTGADTQAVWASNSPGPIEVDNNYLSAAGENILLGGADPTITNLLNSDITITRNHFFKPLKWKQGDPSYAGILWNVKNLLEIKNAQRVLVQGNVLENNWAQAQNGYGVLFTPRNQSGTCPSCGVSNVTFRYNLFQHSGSGFNLSGADAGSPCGDGSGSSQTLRGVSIHDNLILDINGRNWSGADGNLYQILAGNYSTGCSRQGPQNIIINHNTGFQTGKIGNVGDYLGSPTIGGFVFENGIVQHGGGFVGSSEAEGTGTLNAYFTNPYVFMRNVIEAGPSGSYPSGNFFPINWAAVLFVDPTNCNAGTYAITACALQSGSPYHNAATDGKDIGSNIDAINAATAGVSP